MGETHTEDGESPLTYENDGSERLRPGITKLETDIATCPACSGQLVHLPARDPANPYETRSLVMCGDCFRAHLVEVTEAEEPHADTPDPEENPDALEDGTEDADLFDMTDAEEPRDGRPDPEYTDERQGFAGYGFSGPVGTKQGGLGRFETASERRDRDDGEDDQEVMTDGGSTPLRCAECKELFENPPDDVDPSDVTCPECGGMLAPVHDKSGMGAPEYDQSGQSDGEVEHTGETASGEPKVDRYVERFETGVRLKTEVQRGSGTNDRDKVTGEVRRRDIHEAAGELRALEAVMKGHLQEVRGWDESGRDGSDGDETVAENIADDREDS